MIFKREHKFDWIRWSRWTICTENRRLSEHLYSSDGWTDPDIDVNHSISWHWTSDPSTEEQREEGIWTSCWQWTTWSKQSVPHCKITGKVKQTFTLCFRQTEVFLWTLMTIRAAPASDNDITEVWHGDGSLAGIHTTRAAGTDEKWQRARGEPHGHMTHSSPTGHNSHTSTGEKHTDRQTAGTRTADSSRFIRSLSPCLYISALVLLTRSRHVSGGSCYTPPTFALHIDFYKWNIDCEQSSGNAAKTPPWTNPLNRRPAMNMQNSSSCSCFTVHKTLHTDTAVLYWYWHYLLKLKLINVKFRAARLIAQSIVLW